MSAPVALFAYRRPKHLKRTLDSLASAHMARETQLYIFCDGPAIDATKEVRDLIAEVRTIAENENRFAEVIVKTSTSNIGLGKSVVSGVTEVINRHQSIIVLEDDLLVHPDFLVFMNFHLDIYKHEKRVMHISGFQRDSFIQFFLPRIYFTRFMNCSGWATWSDRWSLLITDIDFIDSYLSISYNYERFNFKKLEQSNHLHLNKNGLKTWAIFWYATICIYNGVCINPRFSYIKNIGNDGSGSNNIINSTELTTNLAGQFRKTQTGKGVKETMLGELYIMDAYSKNSKKRLNSVRRLLFKSLTAARRVFERKVF